MYTFDDLQPFLGSSAQIIGDPSGKQFDHVRATTEADAHALTWIAAHRADKHDLAVSTRAAFVVCDESVKLPDPPIPCFVVVPRPKIVFSRILQGLFVPEAEPGIHPSAVLSQKARVHPTATIGPFTYVGDAEIGANTVIIGNCFIHDRVRIGANVVIHAGCVIGGDGFGFERDVDGSVQKFPHLGGVVIEDDVELQTMTHVDRGALADTIVRRGTKVDSCCHIAHNDDIGEDCIIAAHTMFSGSVTLGHRCWVGPSTSFRDVLKVGSDSFIGFGSLVAKSFPDGAELMGNPARPIEEYKQMLTALKKAASG
jgi:UDP-3-O-[3-hydroxymyristoyl] glucosamine N-acyltransferase